MTLLQPPQRPDPLNDPLTDPLTDPPNDHLTDPLNDPLTASLAQLRGRQRDVPLAGGGRQPGADGHSAQHGRHPPIGGESHGGPVRQHAQSRRRWEKRERTKTERTKIGTDPTPPRPHGARTRSRRISRWIDSVRAALLTSIDF